LAFLEDRISLREGHRQKYGSQIGKDPARGENYVLPLDDPEHVDQRRASIGLEPIAQYVKRWHIIWDLVKYKKDLPKVEALYRKQ
jgi:hypothetical protein